MSRLHYFSPKDKTHTVIARKKQMDEETIALHWLEPKNSPSWSLA